MVSPRTLLFLLIGGVLAPIPARAQLVVPPEPVADEIDAAAGALEDDVEVLSLLAATAALIHERTGSYPATQFALLGSPEADRTGAVGLLLSGLTLTPTAAGLEVSYGRTPWAGDGSEHGATFTLAPDAEAGGYAARFTLSRTADIDFGGRRLLFAREGELEVRNAGGRICLDLGRMAGLQSREQWREAAPYLGPGDGLSVAFDTSIGHHRVGTTRLPNADD
ncbi:MAG TPA: hypothetical protein VK610_06855 [Rhodothermales bacterium]|nr:hypothetical protein [Rhodothermales bacterium]